ncbi:MAG TPA: hypothetical protein VIL46_10285, partial [Gemmataceae bacterium]
VPEGFCWGAAFWIKPHVGLVALAVWAVTLARVGGSAPGAGRRAAADALGLLAGGLLAGAPGVAWMVASGAWPHFLDVATNWNPHYYSGFWETLPIRVGEVGMYFPPWSACHLLALPVAVAMLVRARVWSRQPDPADETGRTGKALLAAFYLGWVGQAALLQKGMDYVHAPTVPLALAVLTAQRWPVAAVLFLWCFVSSAVVALVPSQPALHAALDRMPRIVKSWHRMLFFRHPLTDPERLKLWPRCLREGSTPELRDRLGFLNLIFCGTEWRDLYRVADFLRTRNLRDGELACWDDGTHPLYLILNVRPAIRYMHIGTVLSFRAKLEDIRRDVATSPQRYVVSDLTRVRLYHPPFSDADDPADPPGLPPDFPDAARNVFPWNQPVIFRAGRYRVHRVVNPVRAVITPAELRLPPGTLPTE